MSHHADSNWRLVPRTLGRLAAGAVRRPREFRYRFVRELWTASKRFAADDIPVVAPQELPGVRDQVVEGYVDDPNRAVLAAVCRALGAQTFFEIGTNRGRTAWTVARSCPNIQVYTLDLPGPDAVDHVELDLHRDDRALFVEQWNRGEAFAGTLESTRIQPLLGDSATFDFSPFTGKIDVVLVDGAHSYSYVRNDSEIALRLASARGAIVWDDYPEHPGVYRCLRELVRTLPRPFFHISGTRLVISPSADAPFVDTTAVDRYAPATVA